MLLRDNRELPAIAARAEAAAELAQSSAASTVTSLLAEGDSPLERFASLVALGDYASVYLALLEGRRPVRRRRHVRAVGPALAVT